FRRVLFRSVETVEQVNPAGAGRGGAHPDLPGELRVAYRFESRHLLVPGLYEHRVVVRAFPRGEQFVDAVTRIGEDVFDVPLAKPLQYVVRDLDRHGFPSFLHAGPTGNPVACPVVRSSFRGLLTWLGVPVSRPRAWWPRPRRA